MDMLTVLFQHLYESGYTSTDSKPASLDQCASLVNWQMLLLKELSMSSTASESTVQHAVHAVHNREIMLS